MHRLCQFQMRKKFQTKCTFCGGANHSAKICFKRIRKEKKKDCADGDLDNRRTERKPCKFFRCKSEDLLVAKLPKPPKDNEKHQNQVCFSERVNRTSQK